MLAKLSLVLILFYVHVTWRRNNCQNIWQTYLYVDHLYNIIYYNQKKRKRLI